MSGTGKSLAPVADGSPHELDAVRAATAARDALPYRVAMRVEETRQHYFTVTAREGSAAAMVALLSQALGSRLQDFIDTAVHNVIEATAGDEAATNAAFATIAAIAPKDEYEASLAVQIVTAEAAAQQMIRGAIRGSTLKGVAAYGNLATKFQRTALAARETLSRHRTGGVQTVKHVHVNEGGQAIVADTIHLGQGAHNGK